jgi:hypothetical protein
VHDQIVGIQDCSRMRRFRVCSRMLHHVPNLI